MKNRKPPKEHLDFLFHNQYLKKKGYFASYQHGDEYIRILRSKSPSLVTQTIYVPFIYKGLKVKYEP